MRRLIVYAGLTAALLVQGCVTINIYFPAAAAEKAADKIIDEVWQLKKSGEPATPPSNSPQAK
jgi:predicted aminopeptidase